MDPDLLPSVVMINKVRNMMIHVINSIVHALLWRICFMVSCFLVNDTGNDPVPKRLKINTVTESTGDLEVDLASYFVELEKLKDNQVAVKANNTVVPLDMWTSYFQNERGCNLHLMAIYFDLGVVRKVQWVLKSVMKCVLIYWKIILLREFPGYMADTHVYWKKVAIVTKWITTGT